MFGTHVLNFAAIGMVAQGAETSPLCVQEPLPFPEDGLEPYISAKTLSFHYGKHHAAYVAKANELIKTSPLQGKTLEEVIAASSKDSALTPLFNNAAQVWNHAFFWKCLKKDGGRPTGDLLRKIEAAFGSYDDFKRKLSEAAVGRFGSGWAWLVMDNGTLKITSTANADTPIAHGQKPLLTIDVWEHAYYLDYQNRRPDFVNTLIDNLINWDFVAAQM